MNVAREERAHRLPHEVGRGDARDAEAVGELGRDRRLARAGRAADEDHDRQVELAELLVAAQALDRLASLLLAEHLDRERLEPLDLDPCPGRARRSSSRTRLASAYAR